MVVSQYLLNFVTSLLYLFFVFIKFDYKILNWRFWYEHLQYLVLLQYFLDIENLSKNIKMKS